MAQAAASTVLTLIVGLPVAWVLANFELRRGAGAPGDRHHSLRVAHRRGRCRVHRAARRAWPAGLARHRIVGVGDLVGAHVLQHRGRGADRRFGLGSTRPACRTGRPDTGRGPLARAAHRHRTRPRPGDRVGGVGGVPVLRHQFRCGPHPRRRPVQHHRDRDLPAGDRFLQTACRRGPVDDPDPGGRGGGRDQRGAGPSGPGRRCAPATSPPAGNAARGGRGHRDVHPGDTAGTAGGPGLAIAAAHGRWSWNLDGYRALTEPVNGETPWQTMQYSLVSAFWATLDRPRARPTRCTGDLTRARRVRRCRHRDRRCSRWV